MRSGLALAMLTLGANIAVPGWANIAVPGWNDALSLVSGHSGGDHEIASVVEVEPVAPRGDRLNMAVDRYQDDADLLSLSSLSSSHPAVLRSLTPDPLSAELFDPVRQPADGADQPGSTDAIGSSSLPTNAQADQDSSPSPSLDDLCQALLTSAEDNELPVAFFANLIWQESRLRDHAVSPVGAQGIAQFMPEVAMASGLDNPFDPLQAIPASARLLRELRDQFGNLGFVAAAYNAGAHRVSEWLEHGRALPRETRDYVLRVTGRSAEDWRKTPLNDAALTFVRRLPCRGLPAYADLEQAQLFVARLEKATEQLKQEASLKAHAQPEDRSPASVIVHAADRHAAERKQSAVRQGHGAAERADHQKSKNVRRTGRNRSNEA